MALINEYNGIMLDDPDLFIAWLTSKPPTSVAGVRKGLFECPIANFLREELDASVVSSRKTSSTVCWYETRGPDLMGWRESTIAHRPWVGEFIAYVDEDGTGNDITAQECLAILESQGHC